MSRPISITQRALVALAILLAAGVCYLWLRPSPELETVPETLPAPAPELEPAGSVSAPPQSHERAAPSDPPAAAPQAGSALPSSEPKLSAVFQVAGAERLEIPLDEAHKHRLQYWKGRIQPPVTTWEALGALEAEGAVLDFALPDGTLVPLQFKKLERFADNKGVFIASVQGQPFAEAYFSYVNAAVSGVIRFPSAGVSWEVRNAGNGEQYFEQVDLNELGECGVCRAEK